MSLTGIATVARHELRVRVRRGRWQVLVIVWFAVLAGLLGLLRTAVVGDPLGDQEPVGAVMYGGLQLIVLALAVLVVPALSAQSVNGDRERGVLATLQVTRLTAAEIALGKFFAAWGTALVFVAATAPLVVWCMAEGGVRLMSVLVVTVVLATAVGPQIEVTESFDDEEFTFTQPDTRRSWVFLAPNPFVVLADAAPYRGDPIGQGLDPLGGLGRTVRFLRTPPPQGGPQLQNPDDVPPVWPTGLAVNVALALAALGLTAWRLRTPARRLPRGQRVA
jgi:ABC-type transport system involved in cytochrome c biogenesis permease component